MLQNLTGPALYMMLAGGFLMMIRVIVETLIKPLYSACTQAYRMTAIVGCLLYLIGFTILLYNGCCIALANF